MTAHGLFAGSDTGEAWMLLIYIAAAGLVSLGMLLRLFWPTSEPMPQGYAPLYRRDPLPPRR